MNVAEMVTNAIGKKSLALTYRQAEDDDWPDVHRLLRFACSELEERFDTPNALDPIAQIIRFGIANNEAVFVAENAMGDVVGFVAWVGGVPGMPAKTVMGAGTYVLPSCRGGGASAALRELAIAHCRAKGYSRVRGEAAADNEEALASVRALGFREVGIIVELKL